MKKIKLLYLILSLPLLCSAQNKVNGVIEYFPAPGQHINIEKIGTPQAAQQMPETENNLVSLGGFGGYIVLEFEKGCENDPENPYGIDFTIFGNAFSGSSEAGIVWVMEDENNNGLPDDSWYEIAGSHHYYSKTTRNYQLTYYRNTSSRNVDWKDNDGKTGTILANSYNQQEYYPTQTYFPDYPTDSVHLEGTLLLAAIDDTNPNEIKLNVLDFGYADNHPKKQGVALTIPDNPYTPEIEGSGGDPIDISWAVDEAGNYVNLDSIHFIKIVTGYFADLGRLGEASTDVAYVVDVDPDNSVSGKENLLVLFENKNKLLVGDSLLLEARYFLQGKPIEKEITFEPSDYQIVEINENGMTIAKQAGEATVQAATSSGEIRSAIIQVVEPDSIQFVSDFSSIYPGDSILLNVDVFDNLGDKLNIETSFSNLVAETGKIVYQNGDFYFVAEYPGLATIKSIVEGFNVEKTISFQVFSESDKMQIYFTLKTENENLFPLQWIEVGQANLNSFVLNRSVDYSQTNRVLLSHAILAGLQKAGVAFSFRDDENSGGNLYLYELEKDGIYSYGWGGKTEPQAYVKAWIARVNGNQYLNDFNEITITNGDTISLYYVTDITTPWIFTGMVSNKDTAGTGDEVEIILEQTNCNFVDGNIVVSEAKPIINQEINAIQQNYFSDESGRAQIVLEYSPPVIISSGNDAVLISNKIITAYNSLNKIQYKIFPNPVTKQLNILGDNTMNAMLILINSNGQIIQKHNARSNHSVLDLQMYKEGIYFLKIIDNEEVETYKIIKK